MFFWGGGGSGGLFWYVQILSYFGGFLQIAYASLREYLDWNNSRVWIRSIN